MPIRKYETAAMNLRFVAAKGLKINKLKYSFQEESSSNYYKLIISSFTSATIIYSLTIKFIYYIIFLMNIYVF